MYVRMCILTYEHTYQRKNQVVLNLVNINLRYWGLEMYQMDELSLHLK